MQGELLTKRLKARALELGADLSGVADLERVSGIPTIPIGLLEPYTRALVIAVAISPDVFEQIIDSPTPLYAHHYLTVNQILDNIALALQNEIGKKGYRALALPASQIMDSKEWTGHVSSKALAKAAGLGWQGKSLLLVTPQYGPRVRVACILTNAPLEADPLLPNRCGKCMNCQEACPAGAIKGTTWKDHPETREDALEFSKCVEKLTQDFAQRPGIGKPICGFCIKVCPWGRKQKAL